MYSNRAHPDPAGPDHLQCLSFCACFLQPSTRGWAVSAVHEVPVSGLLVLPMVQCWLHMPQVDLAVRSAENTANA